MTPARSPARRRPAIPLLFLFLVALLIGPMLAPGNPSPPPAGRELSPPQITAPLSGDLVAGLVRITGTSGGADVVQARVDAGSWWNASGASSWHTAWNASAATDGAHVIAARALLGNLSSALANVSVTVTHATPGKIRLDWSVSPKTVPVGNTVTVTGSCQYDSGVRAVWAVARVTVASTEVNRSTATDALGTFTLSFPAPDRPGRRTLAASVTDGNLSVSAETTLTITSEHQPELAVSKVSSDPASPIAGRAATISATVVNTGNATASATLRVQDGTSSASPAIGSQNLTLDPGGSRTVEMGWTPAAGNHTVLAKLEQIDPEDQNQSNDSKSVLVIVQAVPDIAVLRVVAANPKPVAGRTTSLSVAMRNQGGAEGIGTVVVSMVGHAVGEKTRTEEIGRTPVNIPVGANRTVLVRWDPEEGQWTITANVTGVLPEDGDATNNQASVTVEVSPAPVEQKRSPGFAAPVAALAILIVALLVRLRGTARRSG